MKGYSTTIKESELLLSIKAKTGRRTIKYFDYGDESVLLNGRSEYNVKQWRLFIGVEERDLWFDNRLTLQHPHICRGHSARDRSVQSTEVAVKVLREKTTVVTNTRSHFF